MKVIWIYLAVSCLAFKKCSSEEILQTYNASDVVSEDGDSSLASWSKNIPATIEEENNYYLGNITQPLTSCPQAFEIEGIFEITVPGLDPFPVLCNAQIAGAGYIVIASRSNVELNFYRNWTEYQRGFGDLLGDFFIGLDKLHAITKSQNFELYVHLEDFKGLTRFARYDEFYIENENELYKLSKLGAYTGDAGNSLLIQKGQNFTTYDNDNDSSSRNCAQTYLGAWWYNNCHQSNLFGMYYAGAYNNSMFAQGMDWRDWHGYNYAYKSMKMMLRPKCCCT